MADFTYDDVPDQTGKIVLITGANAGLGFALAADFIQRTNCESLILACRSESKTQCAIVDLGSDKRLSFVELDLADLDSVSNAAKTLKEKFFRIDTLILNAGVWPQKKSTTKQGFETTMGVCHLGHFLFTALLWPLLLNSSKARIVSVSSVGHTWTKSGIDLSDLDWKTRKFDQYEAYFQAKLANVLFAKELAKRTSAAGLPITAVTLSPGFGRSELYRDTTSLMKCMLPCISETNEKLSINTMRAATDETLSNGTYLTPKRMSFYGPPIVVECSKLGQDMDQASKLWQLSEELVGQKFEIAAK